MDPCRCQFYPRNCTSPRLEQTLSRQFLLDYVWSYAAEVQPSMVDVYISYLRAKLRVPGMKDPIHTRRSFGYLLDPNHA